MSRLRLMSILMVVALFGAACGGDDATATATDAALEDGTFTTVSGAQLDFGDLEGQDTVLWFWAPW